MSLEKISPPDQDLFSLYRADVMRNPLLTAEQTQVHAQAVCNGILELKSAGVVKKFVLPEIVDGDSDDLADEYDLCSETREKLRDAYDSCDTLWVSNLRYVIKLAGPYAKATGQPLMDIIQEGNLGLSQAVRKYDYRKGFAFTTYASSWIRQAMKRGIDNTGSTIRIPVHMQQSIKRMQSSERRIAGLGLSGEDYLSRLAVEMSISVETAREIYRANTMRTADSLSRPLSHESTNALEDTLPDQLSPKPEDVVDSVLANEMVALVSAALADNPELLETVQKAYGVGGYSQCTIRELADEYGLTHQAISIRLKRDAKIVRDYAEFYGISPASEDV